MRWCWPTKHTYLGAQYRRLAAHWGAKKAAVAVGHTIRVIVYHLLKQGAADRDLSPEYFDQRDRDSVRRRLVDRLQKLGSHVTVEDPIAA